MKYTLKIVMSLVGLLLLTTVVSALDSNLSASIKVYSMQDLLQSRDGHIKEKVSVIGYLSENCGGLCMFAYKDDAKTFNVSNSIQLILDGETIKNIIENCSDQYVSIFGLIDKVEGFYYPGFINVDSIRAMKSATNRVNVCWEKE